MVNRNPIPFAKRALRSSNAGQVPSSLQLKIITDPT